MLWAINGSKNDSTFGRGEPFVRPNHSEVFEGSEAAEETEGFSSCHFEQVPMNPTLSR